MNIDPRFDGANNEMKREKHDLLRKLGFRQKKNNKWEHALIDNEFDFSANSIETIVMTIHHKGHAAGLKQKAKEIKRTLYIEEDLK